MRRKSIGATSQAFHEPMSTGAFLEFLTGCRALGPGPAAEMLERRREPRLSWNCTARYGSVLRPGPMGLRQEVKNLVCRKSTVRVAGSRPQGPVGQVSRGLGARAPRAWGPAHQGPGAFSPQKTNLSNYDFFANLLAGAWRRRGCRLKRLLRRWGPGGKRSREKGRGFSPSPPSATIQHAPQGRRTSSPSPAKRSLNPEP